MQLQTATLLSIVSGAISFESRLEAAQPFAATPILTSPTSTARSGDDIAILDVTGVPSMDGFRSTNNFVMYLWIGPNNILNGMGWDVALQTSAPGSRLSDIAVFINNTANLPNTGVVASPAAGDEVPGGPTTYSTGGDILKFADYSVPNVQALADGLIRLEFLDDPDELAGVQDGLWTSGHLYFQTLLEIPVPAPTTMAPLLAFGMLAATKRSRSNS